MENPTIPWEWWRSFLAVLDGGSLSAAARHLGLTQPTLGRHIAALEEQTGASLFTRHNGGLRPTPLALSLRPQAHAMAHAASALGRSIITARDAPMGHVRLTCPAMIGTMTLPGPLLDFRRQYPGITVELALDDRVQDLLAGQSDLAIRLVRPTQSALVTRQLGTLHLGLYAAQSYLERHPAPTRTQDLARHSLIGGAREQAAMPDLPRAAFGLQSDSDLALLMALRAGHGIGVAQIPLARQWPELQRILPEISFERPVWLAWHGDNRATLPIRLLSDHLARTLGAWLRPSAGQQQDQDPQHDQHTARDFNPVDLFPKEKD